jgi:two-component system, NarL family, response regulator NreC
MATTAELARTAAASSASREKSLPITVALADDHEPTRRSLRSTLEAEPDLEVVAVADDLDTTLRSVKEHLPRILLLDLGMPGGSTTELIRRLRAQVPETAIVVVTMEDSPVIAEHALRAGAVGYVLKHHADAELLDAIHCAAKGQRYISPKLGARLRVP